MAEEAPEASPAEGPLEARFAALEAGAKQVREAAKWLVTVTAAVGAALIAGTQFSSIGKVEDIRRLIWAGVAAGVALAALGVIIWFLLDVMTPKSRTLLDATGDFADRYREAFRGYALDGPALQRVYLDALEEQAAAIRGNTAMPPTVSDHEVEAAEIRVQDIGGAAQDVKRLCSYEAQEGTLNTRTKRVLFGALFATGVATLVFVYAANPPEKKGDGAAEAATSEPVASLAGTELVGANLAAADLKNVDMHGVNLTDATLIDAALNDADLRNANLTRADLSNVDLTGANLTGATLASTIWKNTVCPDGFLVSGDESCATHRTAG